MTHTASQNPAPAPLAALRSTRQTAVTLLRVYGEDAFSYLQSQVTADLRAVGERWVRYTLWLDSRGYVQADSFILREAEESFLLFSYATPAAQLEEIVLANVIADDVEVESLGEGYCHWALWGEENFLPSSVQPQAGCWAGVAVANTAENATNEKTGASAETTADKHGGADVEGFTNTAGVADGEKTLPALLFAGRNSGGQNYDLLLPRKTALPAFIANLEEVPWGEREARRIADGIAAIPTDIGPADFPQEGADLVKAAVSTSKGCYLGQEVIARWHATLQVRSGLFRLRLLPGKSFALAEPTTETNATAPENATGQAADSGQKLPPAAQSLSPAAQLSADQLATTQPPFAPDGKLSAHAQSPADQLPAQSSLAPAGAPPALPLRLYAETKSVGQLRSFAPQSGAGLALLRIHRLGDARRLCVQAGEEAIFEVLEPMVE